MDLEWTIQNQSSQPWPQVPLLKNMSADDEVPQPVCSEDGKLAPNSSIKVKYTYLVPSDVQEPFQIFKLYLVDPVKHDRFGDVMTGVCTFDQQKVQPAEEIKEHF